MHKPIDPHDDKLLALWLVITFPKNPPEKMDRDAKKFYEFAKLELKEIYGIEAKEIEDLMMFTYKLGPYTVYDWRKDYV